METQRNRGRYGATSQWKHLVVERSEPWGRVPNRDTEPQHQPRASAASYYDLGHCLGRSVQFGTKPDWVKEYVRQTQVSFIFLFFGDAGGHFI